MTPILGTLGLSVSVTVTVCSGNTSSELGQPFSVRRDTQQGDKDTAEKDGLGGRGGHVSLKLDSRSLLRERTRRGIKHYYFFLQKAIFNITFIISFLF